VKALDLVWRSRLDLAAEVVMLRHENQSQQAKITELRGLLGEARNVLANSGAESGYCMCGDPVEGHNIGSGHSPVDSHSYMAVRLVDKIDTAISTKEPLP